MMLKFTGCRESADEDGNDGDEELLLVPPKEKSKRSLEERLSGQNLS